MANELITLGAAHAKKSVLSIPQLSVDGFFISLSKLHSDPRMIFSRMQYRICALPSVQLLSPSFCSEDYNPLVESLVRQSSSHHFQTLMIQEQEERESRSSPRRIKYSKHVYSRHTLAEFADTIQHPVIDVTVVTDIATPLPESLRNRVLDLLVPSFDAITRLSLLPILSTTCEPSDARLECQKYRSFLCGFFIHPDAHLQQRLQLCILGIGETSDFSASLRACVESQQLFYPGMRFCLEESTADGLARNMTRLMREVAERVEDPDVIAMLAADMEEDVVSGDHEYVSMDHEYVSMDHEYVSMDHKHTSPSTDSSDEEEVIRHLLPLTVLVNNRRGNLNQSLREQVCASIIDSTPLPCSGRTAVVAPKRQTGTEMKLYLQMNCRQNVQTLNDVFDWLARNPE